MARNNEDRIGARTIQSESPPPQLIQQTDQADKLSFVVPTEFVELPSKGIFYPEGHPLHNQECVEIKFMTAKEEDILSDKALLKKGLAIDRLFKSVVVNRNININSLLVGDRNAILIASRINGYGPEYDTKVVCPVCFSHGRHEFNLEDREIKYANFSEEDESEVEKTQQGTFIFTLPKTQVKVECKLLTGKDEKSLVEASERRKKQRLPEAALTSQLRTIVVSIDGNSDRSYVNSFIETMPVLDSRYLRTVYNKCTPDVSIKEIFSCLECDAETDLEIPFTTDFFWPNT